MMDLVQAMQHAAPENRRLDTILEQFAVNHETALASGELVEMRAIYLLVSGRTVWGVEFRTSPHNFDLLLTGAQLLLERSRTITVHLDDSAAVLNTRNVESIDLIRLDEHS